MMAEVTDINSARTPCGFALRYAALGWWVLPLDQGSKKPLGRLVRNGFHDATTDESLIRAWWSQYPAAGIGIALKRSGLVAVDIDPRNGGIETIDRLEALHGAIESDVLAYTGGGGEHRVFAAELVEHLPGKLGPGVDLKADGYIAVEPTFAPLADPPHKKPYAWEASSDPLDGVIPSTLPGWIRDLGRGSHAPAMLSASQAPAVAPIDARRLASAKAALEHVKSDDRDTWFTFGMAIHQEMPTQQGYDLWCQWSQASPKFDDQDQLRVWRSFKRRSISERRVDLTAIFATAQRAGWKNDGGVLAVQETETQPAVFPILNISELEQASANVTWAVKHVIPADSLGVMFGASGTFKSFVALDFALHTVHGMTWLGKKTKKGSVLFIAAEGGAGVWRRVKAWHIERGLKWQGIEFYVLPMAVMLNVEAKKVVQSAAAVGVTPSNVIVDTMSQTFDGEENSANEVAGYFRELGNQFRALWRCVVLVVHHSGHSATERPRGSSAILANVDFMLGVFRDEREMLATVTCEKQKDGDRFEPVQFSLGTIQLGMDEDSEPITSLAARHVNSAEALLAAHKAEAAAGRGGREILLVSMAQTGMTEKQLRHAFYEALGPMDVDSKKKAFYRARDAALNHGFIDFGTESGSMERQVIVLRGLE